MKDTRWPRWFVAAEAIFLPIFRLDYANQIKPQEPRRGGMLSPNPLRGFFFVSVLGFRSRGIFLPLELGLAISTKRHFIIII